MPTNNQTNKIIGHHPGRMNKATEAYLESDFTAGKSWTHIKDALALMGIKSGYGKKAIQKGLKQWSRLSQEQVIENLKRSGVKVVKTKEKYLTGRARRTFFGSGKIEYNPLGFKIMGKHIGQSQAQYGKQTFAHEVLELVAGKERFTNIAGKKHYFKRVIPGVSGGQTAKALGWTHKDIGVITGEIRFSEAAGIPYKSMGIFRAAEINKAAVPLKGKRFLRRYSKILDTGTAGTTNIVMHGKRTQHQIMDVEEKTKHLFNI